MNNTVFRNTGPRLLQSLRRDGLSKGIFTLWIGGGQGIALAPEIV
ncbi:hypothetical protein [Agrobacterium fabrum]|nr:hypothetical protein [Agrobacterium fabrum]MCR6727659.1 hypothetical protein [Agrobacterium fabrum]